MVAPAAVAALWLLAAPARGQDHAHGHPDVAIRIDQALLELDWIVDAERRALRGKIDDFKVELKEDGLHASGKYKIPILPDVRFETVAAFVWTGPNVFEIRVRKIKVLFFNVTGMVVETIEGRLRDSLQGACAFQRLGELSDGSHALRVTVDMKALMPSLPTLALSGITTRDQVLILKARLP